MRVEIELSSTGLRRGASLMGVLLIALLCTSCATGTGHNTSWTNIRMAAGEAITDRATWMPLVAAGVFAIDDFDEEVTEWASDKAPLFGSQSRADDSSDTLAALSHVTLGVAAIPSFNKLESLAPALGAHLINFGFTQASKENINRERPDKDGSESFPSGHTSYAVVSAIQASNLIDQLDISRTGKRNFRIANYSVAGLAAWARVEANRHYPSDILTSIALGNFATGFVNRLLEENINNRNQVLRLDTNGNTGIRFSYAYSW